MMQPSPLEPYHFRPEELHPHIQKHLEGTAEFHFNEQDFTYGLLNPAVAPVHNVVGMYGGQNLIASSAIPSDLLPLYLQHEIICNRIRYNEDGRCADIESKLLEEIPQEMVVRLLKERHRTFEDLALLNEIDLQNPEAGFKAEIAGTTLFLRRKIKELGLE